MSEFKQIEEEFDGKGEVKGVRFKLLKRDGLKTLWERSDGYYEVVELREQKASTKMIAGVEVTFEAKEVYPSGDSWTGKCVSSLEKAEQIFKTF